MALVVSTSVGAILDWQTPCGAAVKHLIGKWKLKRDFARVDVVSSIVALVEEKSLPHKFARAFTVK